MEFCHFKMTKTISQCACNYLFYFIWGIEKLVYGTTVPIKGHSRKKTFSICTTYYLMDTLTCSCAQDSICEKSLFYFLFFPFRGSVLLFQTGNGAEKGLGATALYLYTESSLKGRYLALLITELHLLDILSLKASVVLFLMRIRWRQKKNFRSRKLSYHEGSSASLSTCTRLFGFLLVHFEVFRSAGLLIGC